jgi:hypothetical protein
VKFTQLKVYTSAKIIQALVVLSQGRLLNPLEPRITKNLLLIKKTASKTANMRSVGKLCSAKTTFANCI